MSSSEATEERQVGGWPKEARSIAEHATPLGPSQTVITQSSGSSSENSSAASSATSTATSPAALSPALTATVDLQSLIDDLRASSAFAHKRDIAPVLDALRQVVPNGASCADAGSQAIDNGDDCAALHDGHGGYLLFAMEGMIDSFVRDLPWFAGYSAVMVNVSDIYAMGGRPMAVLDAIWSEDAERAGPVMQGMRDAATRYGVPLVGGHTNHRAGHAGLAVAILGRATRLLAAAAARAGDALIIVTDLRGGYVEPHAFWNASTEAPAERLRGDLEVIARLAEEGLCRSAKDISMAGALGSTLMLLEAAGLGAEIDLNCLPKPANVPMARWLLSFPSYGFVLTVAPGDVPAVLARFHLRDLDAAVIGHITSASKVTVIEHDQRATLWDFANESFTGARSSRPGGLGPAKVAPCQ